MNSQYRVQSCLPFTDKQITITLGNRMALGISDIYIDQNFWGLAPPIP